MGLIEKIFGTHSENELKRIYPIVDRIDALEPEIQVLSDQELKDKTREFKQRLSDGETLDDILPEAYAVPGTADRRDHSPSGTYRGDANRRGKDFSFHASGVFECAFGKRRAYRHSQRLSGKA